MPYQKNAISIGNKELRFVDAATGNPIEIDVDIYSSEIHVRSEVFVIKIPGQTLDWGHNRCSTACNKNDKYRKSENISKWEYWYWHKFSNEYITYKRISS